MDALTNKFYYACSASWISSSRDVVFTGHHGEVKFHQSRLKIKGPEMAQIHGVMSDTSLIAFGVAHDGFSF